MRDVGEILEEVRSKIAAACRRSGRSTDEVEIVAVTKTHDENVVREARDAGLMIVGENKVQEAAWKKPLSVAGPSWHLIGHLQTNKVRAALELFDVIHSVDSIRLIDRIESVAEAIGARPRILLEVNVSGEKSKSGLAPEMVEETLEYLLNHCRRTTVEGFMTMAPIVEKSEDARPYFRRLRELRDECERKLGIGLPRLSMGMSGDYEVAIEEGATWVRLGTVLFGERPKVKRLRREPDAAEDGGFAGYDSHWGEAPVVKILN